MINEFKSRYRAKSFAENIGLTDFTIVSNKRSGVTTYRIYIPLNLLGITFPTRYTAFKFTEEAGIEHYVIRKIGLNKYVIYCLARIIERGI